jgi:hypothetical protein
MEARPKPDQALGQRPVRNRPGLSSPSARGRRGPAPSARSSARRRGRAPSSRRGAGLEVVHQEVAGLEGGAAVAGGGGDKDDRLAGGDLADAVQDEDVGQAEAGAGAAGDFVDLGLGEAGIGLQLQQARGPGLGAGQAGEGGHGAHLGAPAAELGEQTARVEGFEGEPDGHPPLIGGRKATSVRAFSGASPRTMTWSTATCTPGAAERRRRGRRPRRRGSCAVGRGRPPPISRSRQPARSRRGPNSRHAGHC